MSDQKNTCAHPACSCVPMKDSKYCSQYCQDAGVDDVEISCDCKHPGCALTL